MPNPSQDDLELILKIGGDATAIDKVLQDVAKTGDKTALPIYRELTKELGAQSRELMKINAAQTPVFVKEQARLELAKAQSQAQLDQAVAWEKGILHGVSHKMKSLMGKDREAPALLGAIFGTQGGGGFMGGAGGMVGAAFGGPIGALMGKYIGVQLGKIPEALGTVIAAPAKLASAGLEVLGHSLKELQGPLGPIGAGFDLLTTGLTSLNSVLKSIPIIGSILGPLGDVLAGIPGIFKDITTTLTAFAEKASPGQFKMWQMALEDVQGVIGQAFLPVLELMREGVRLFGDVLANILPNFTEVRGALAEFRAVFGQFGDELRKVLADIGPSIRETVIAGLRQFAHWIGVVARAAVMAVQELRALGWFGGIEGRGGEFRSSVGAAAQPARITGIEEYEKSFQTAAFSLPGQLSKEDQQLGALKDLGDTEKQAKELLVDIKGFFTKAEEYYSWAKTESIKVFQDIKQVATSAKIVSDWITGGQGWLDFGKKIGENPLVRAGNPLTGIAAILEIADSLNRQQAKRAWQNIQ